MPRVSFLRVSLPNLSVLHVPPFPFASLPNSRRKDPLERGSWVETLSLSFCLLEARNASRALSLSSLSTSLRASSGRPPRAPARPYIKLGGIRFAPHVQATVLVEGSKEMQGLSCPCLSFFVSFISVVLFLLPSFSSVFLIFFVYVFRYFFVLLFLYLFISFCISFSTFRCCLSCFLFVFRSFLLFFLVSLSSGVCLPLFLSFPCILILLSVFLCVFLSRGLGPALQSVLPRLLTPKFCKKKKKTPPCPIASTKTVVVAFYGYRKKAQGSRIGSERACTTHSLSPSAHMGGNKW